MDGPVLVRISYLIAHYGREYSYLITADHAEKELAVRCYATVKNWTGERFENLLVKLGFGSDFTTDLENRESRKVLAAKFLKVPFTKQYVYNARWGKYARMYYRIANSLDNGMGQFALKPGKARIYIRDRQGEELFLGEDWAKATPREETLDLFVGQARDVAITRNVMKIVNFNWNKHWMHDHRKVVEFQLENFKDTPLTLQIREQFAGEWNVTQTDMEFERIDNENGTFSITLPPKGEKVTVRYTLVRYHILTGE